MPFSTTAYLHTELRHVHFLKKAFSPHSFILGAIVGTNVAEPIKPKAALAQWINYLVDEEPHDQL